MNMYRLSNARPCQVCSEKSRIFNKLNAVRRLRSGVLSVPEKVSLGPISIPRDRTVSPLNESEAGDDLPASYTASST